MNVATKIRLVSSHSSYLARFTDPSTQVNVLSSSENKVISVHKLLALTLSPYSSYIGGLARLTLSGKKKYPLPVSALTLSILLNLLCDSSSPSFSRSTSLS